MAKNHNPNAIRMSTGDKVFNGFVTGFMVLVFTIIAYPLIYMISASFSSTRALLAGEVFLWPVEPNLLGYETVFKYSGVLRGFGNSFLYVLMGTVLNVAVTMCCAFALSKKKLLFRNTIMFLFTFTMFFSGGLIPSYLLVMQLGMINSRWAMIIPGLMSVYNMILARTFIQSSIPEELAEAAYVDGCSDFRYFFQMVLPLSKSIIAVITLYYAVGHWNAWFNAFLYLDDRKLYPLQLILREILVANDINMDSMNEAVMNASDGATQSALVGMQELMKYAMIVLSSAPAILMYPFIQKYFVTGVMIGSLKG